MGTGPEVAERGYRPRADRGARRRTPLLRRRGRVASAAPRCSRRCRSATQRASDELAAAQAAHRARRRADGPRARHRPAQGAAVPQLRAPALGRGRRPLPDVRQLHDGLPDLLLHDRRGRDRPRRASDVERHQRWDSCFTVDYSHIHGGAVRSSATLALPPVDDPQARDLVRPVRQLRLRRLRALHHLVPGRDRHHRGGARDPRDRGRAQCRRSTS